MEDMDLENRIVSTGLTETDTDIENSLPRPKTLEDYSGRSGNPHRESPVAEPD